MRERLKPNWAATLCSNPTVPKTGRAPIRLMTTKITFSSTEQNANLSRHMALLCLFSAVALSACGGGDDSSGATALAATPTVSAAAPTAAVPSPAPATGSPSPAPATAPIVAPTSAVGSLLPPINPAVIPAALPAFTTARRASAGGDPPAASDIGAFRTSCTVSHMNFDDPLVYPGQVGASHLHVFWGNSDTNANSTAASIASSGGSTCAGGILNRPAYWAPAMGGTATNTPIAPS